MARARTRSPTGRGGPQSRGAGRRTADGRPSPPLVRAPLRLTPYARHVLELRPNCECCDADLPPDSPDARICTFECTFCARCVDEVLRGVCPNCGGNLVARPIRPAEKLVKYPASTQRVLKPQGCGKAA